MVGLAFFSRLGVEGLENGTLYRRVYICYFCKPLSQETCSDSPRTTRAQQPLAEGQTCAVLGHRLRRIGFIRTFFLSRIDEFATPPFGTGSSCRQNPNPHDPCARNFDRSNDDHFARLVCGNAGTFSMCTLDCTRPLKCLLYGTLGRAPL